LLKPVTPETEAKRRNVFDRYVDRTETCWLWTGPRTTNGYGAFRVGSVQTGAHRWAWLWVNGPIPDGLQIHHNCRTRLCVNPAHLAVVTRTRNLQNREFKAWKTLDQRVEAINGELLNVTLTPVHSAWVRARAAETGRAVDEIVALAIYGYMANLAYRG
jgi:hypothetical protein